MVITITDPKLDQAIAVSSVAAGQSADDFVVSAVREKLAIPRTGGRRSVDWEMIRAVQERIAAMPQLDGRGADELIGYDEDGLFGR